MITAASIITLARDDMTSPTGPMKYWLACLFRKCSIISGMTGMKRKGSSRPFKATPNIMISALAGRPNMREGPTKMKAKN